MLTRRQTLQAATTLAAASLVPMRTRTNRRVLLVDLDDIGHDLFASALAAGKIPNLAGYKAVGTWFPRFWAASICSVFRARVLTGLDGYRAGNLVLWNVFESPTFAGPTAPWICSGLSGISGKVGKWHLCSGGLLSTVAGPGGFGSFRGVLANLPSYTAWMQYDSATGTATPQTEHATTSVANDALDLVEAEVDFVNASFHCVHSPLELPPDNDPPGATYSGTTQLQKKHEMLRHLDYHIGRLVDAAIARDYVVLIACDNGTDGAGKGTVFESALCTPMLAVGNGVGATVCRHLVSATDLFATVREILGDGGRAADSVSFANEVLATLTGAPERAYLTYDDCTSHVGVPPTPSTWRRAIRSKRWKLIDNPSGIGERFYDLDADPTEQTNLLAGRLDAEQAAAYQDLLAHLPTLS